MFVYQKNPVAIELFSHVKTFFYSKLFGKLLTTWLKAINKHASCKNSYFFFCNISMHLSTLLPRALRRSQVQSACPIDLYFLRIPVNKGTTRGWLNTVIFMKLSIRASTLFLCVCSLERNVIKVYWMFLWEFNGWCQHPAKGMFTWRWGTPNRWGNMWRVTPPIM